MPVEYGFLKYGKPLVAAAPILIGLNLLPSTAEACTGSANDPVHCANNEGQIVDGFGSFYLNNLQGLPGASTVPGDTPQGAIPGAFDAGAFVTNTSTGGSSPLSAPGISGIPQLPGSPAPGTDPTRDPIVDYYVTAPGYDGGNHVVIDPVTGDIDLRLSVEQAPAEFGEMIELADDDDSGPSFTEECRANAQACQAGVRNFFIQIAPAISEDHRAEIFDAAAFIVDDDDGPGSDLTQFFEFDQQGQFEQDRDLANALVDSLRERFGKELEVEEVGFPVVNDDDNDLDLTRAVPGGGTPPTGAQSAPADTGESTENPAERQLASLQRLRDRAAAETDPEKKQELEERVARFDKLINSFGSSAIRAGLHNQDTQTTPLPGRN